MRHRSWRRLAWCSFVLMSVAAPVLAAQQGRLVTETEPNDDAAHANLVQLGDTIGGNKTYRNIDFFAVDIPAGTKLVVHIVLQNFCATLHLWDRDGQHSLKVADCASGEQPLDSIKTIIATAGRYFVSIQHSPSVEDPGDEGRVLPYKLRIARYAPPPTGIGNPLSRLAAMGDEIRGMVAAPNGDLLVTHHPINSGQVALSRVTPNGAISIIDDNVNTNGQMAIDALGDLIMPGWNEVSRYNLTTGGHTRFTGEPAAEYAWHGVTIGADGDVWLSAVGSGGGMALYRFDAFGHPKGQVATGVDHLLALATAENGELLFIDYRAGDVYRLLNNTTPVRVIAGEGRAFENLAIDRDGWIYVTEPARGKMLLYNPQYQLARDPLAQVLDSVGWKDEHMMAIPTWMRDKNGKMTSRLLLTRGPGQFSGAEGMREILEVNPRAMGAPGADPGLKLKRKSLRNGIMNAAYADTLQLDGTATATWSFVSGKLPDGLALGTNGVLTGTPSKNGTFDFLVRASSGPSAGFGRFSITVGDAPPVQVSVSDVANALMGGTALSPAIVQYLDNLGNKNGRLDVGDFRAYLRSQGQLSGTPKP